MNRLAAISLIAAWMVAAPAVHAQQAAAAGRSSRQFRRFSGEISGLRSPRAVAIGPQEEIYIADTGNHRICVVAMDGRELRSWGGLGSVPGQFHSPAGIAIGPQGQVFVADTANHRIQVFNPKGAVQHTFGSYGAGPGHFHQPRGLVIHQQNLLVADSGNRRVQVFDLNGQLTGTIPAAGQPNDLMRPVDVAVDARNRVLIADAWLDRIAVFNSDGTLQDQWGGRGVFPGMLSAPSALRYYDQAVYVADTNNQRIEVFDADGNYRYHWGEHAVVPREGSGKFHYPAALAVNGKVAIVCEPLEDRCQMFTPLATAPVTPPPLYPGGGITHYGPRIHAAGGLLVATDPDSLMIDVFKVRPSDPVLITQFGGPGETSGRLRYPVDVHVGQDPWRVCVADAGNHKLHIFGLDYAPDRPLRFAPEMARLIKSLDLAAVAQTAGLQDIDPRVIRKDAANRWYLIDAGARILVFDESFKFLYRFGGYGADRTQLSEPTDLAFSLDGKKIFVVDRGNFRIQVFDRGGTHVTSWGTYGSGVGQFQEPYGITAGKDGYVYVTDVQGNRVIKFNERGRFTKQWGTPGIGAGQFHKPRGIVQDEDGRIIVVDHGNHRGQIFTPDGAFVYAFGSRFYTTPANRAAKQDPES